ncbi:hypothetical protein JOD96_000083 [Flavobacterium sp. 1355]|nr:hypothetical protein [Flavobacterium sp. 1355]
MELTNTLLLKFALVTQIILALYFLISYTLKFIVKINFGVLADLFSKFKYFVSLKFLLLNPFNGFVIKICCDLMTSGCNKYPRFHDSI